MKKSRHNEKEQGKDGRPMSASGRVNSMVQAVLNGAKSECNVKFNYNKKPRRLPDHITKSPMMEIRLEDMQHSF